MTSQAKKPGMARLAEKLWEPPDRLEKAIARPDCCMLLTQSKKLDWSFLSKLLHTEFRYYE